MKGILLYSWGQWGKEGLPTGTLKQMWGQQTFEHTPPPAPPHLAIATIQSCPSLTVGFLLWIHKKWSLPSLWVSISEASPMPCRTWIKQVCYAFSHQSSFCYRPAKRGRKRRLFSVTKFSSLFLMIKMKMVNWLLNWAQAPSSISEAGRWAQMCIQVYIPLVDKMDLYCEKRKRIVRPFQQIVKLSRQGWLRQEKLKLTTLIQCSCNWCIQFILRACGGDW